MIIINNNSTVFQSETVINTVLLPCDDTFSFDLNKAQTSSVISNYGETYQEDNGMFFQIMCALHGDNYRQPKADTVIDDLFNIIIYVDFKGIFDRSSKYVKNALRQKKAESMFRPEGMTLDLGNGKHKYVAFERSASMSRNARLSFIRADFYDTVRKRITLDLDIRECELSKLYAYNGLMFSSGVRVEFNDNSFWNRIVVIFRQVIYLTIFENEDLIAIAGCGVDEMHGLRLNNCCNIRFADRKGNEEFYRLIFKYITNDLLVNNILPFDDLQHGEYAAAHGGFASTDYGFEIVNRWFDVIR